MNDVVFGVVLGGGLLLPPLIFGLWFQALIVFAFFLCFGAIEVISLKTTGKSVSQTFWAFSKKNKGKAWFLLVAWLVAWVSLLLHFAKDLL